MALTQISTDGVENDAISHNKIPANAIQASELADNAVDTAAIADEAVTLAKLEHGTSSNDGKFLRANNGADPTFETVNTDLVADTSPQLGGALDTNGVNINFGDSTSNGNNVNRLRFGTATNGDLEIYHDGSNSYITDRGTGELRLYAAEVLRIRDTDSAEDMGVFNKNGSVDLYHNNSKKFETTSGGIDVTGAITVNGSALGSGGLISTDSDSGYLTSGNQSLSSSYSEIMELQITPSSSSNKVAIFSTMVLQTNGSHTWGGPAANHKVTRTVGGTTTTLIDQDILYQRDNVLAAKYLLAPSSIDYMDSPNTTSQVTYKIYAKYSDTATSGSVKSYKSIAMEVAV